MRRLLLLLLTVSTVYAQPFSFGGGAGGSSGAYFAPSASYTAGGGPYYFAPGGSGAASTTETVQGRAQIAGTLQNYSVHAGTAIGAGNTITLTWRDNAADQAVTCTIDGSVSQDCNSGSLNFAVAKNDLINIKLTATGTPNATTLTMLWGTPGTQGPTGLTGPAGTPTPSAVNAQSGTSYPFVNGDCSKEVSFSNASPVAVTLPQAGAGGNFAANCTILALNKGPGLVTITPTTSTLGGASSQTLNTGGSASIVSDGVNYDWLPGKGAVTGIGTNDTNFQLSLSNGIITPAWASTLSTARGGLGGNFSACTGLAVFSGGTVTCTNNPVLNTLVGQPSTAVSALIGRVTLSGTEYGIEVQNKATNAHIAGIDGRGIFDGKLNILGLTQCVHVDSAGTPSGTGSDCGVGGGGISSLNTLTGSSQTFVNDTNFTIVSSGTTHTLTWAGTLAAIRGGLGGDFSACSGVPLFAAGASGCNTTTGTGSFVRAIGPTFTGTMNGVALILSSNFTQNGGTTNLSSVAHFIPLSGAAASKPGTCTPGEVYMATDATAGQNWYFCTALNTWTQQLNSGSGIVSQTTGAGAPAGSCTAPSTGNLTVYTDTTAQDEWFCSATNTWKKIISTTNSGTYVATGNTGTAPANPSAGQVTCYFDSTANTQICLDTTGNAFIGVKGAATRVVNQYMTHIDALGLQHQAQPDWADLTSKPATFAPVAPTLSTLGGTKSIDCTGTGHLLKIDTTGTPTCSADSGGSTGVGRATITPTFTAIPDGACQEQTATWTGVGTGDTVISGWPAALTSGLIGNVRTSAADTVAARLCNFSGASVTPGGQTINLTLAIYNLSGTSTIDFTSIADGVCLANTFTLTGVAAGDPVAPKWPAGLEAGLVGNMLASATDTVQVRLCNWSGASVDPASATFGASIAK